MMAKNYNELANGLYSHRLLFALLLLAVGRCSFRDDCFLLCRGFLDVLGSKLEGQAALAARLSVEMHGHEHTGSALVGGALAAQTVNLAVSIDRIVLEDGELDFDVLVLDLFWGGVRLLLALLATSAQTQHEVQRGLFLDVVVGKRAAVLELLAGKDEALLVGGDALLVLDLLLDVVDGVARLDLEGDGLARERLDKDLHLVLEGL